MWEGRTAHTIKFESDLLRRGFVSTHSDEKSSWKDWRFTAPKPTDCCRCVFPMPGNIGPRRQLNAS